MVSDIAFVFVLSVVKFICCMFLCLSLNLRQKIRVTPDAWLSMSVVGSLRSCLWFSCVLASDRHLSLCFVSSYIIIILYYYISFSVMFRRLGTLMRTEHIFVSWSCIRIKVEVSRELN